MFGTQFYTIQRLKKNHYYNLERREATATLSQCESPAQAHPVESTTLTAKIQIFTIKPVVIHSSD